LVKIPVWEVLQFEQAIVQRIFIDAGSAIPGKKMLYYGH